MMRSRTAAAQSPYRAKTASVTSMRTPLALEPRERPAASVWRTPVPGVATTTNVININSVLNGPIPLSDGPDGSWPV